MYELTQVAEKTFYINCPTKIGIYKINENDVFIIDSGNNKDVAKKIQKILTANNWNLSGIINTHSHVDHIGGNNLLQQRLDCKIYAPKVEKVFIENVLFESTFLYGANPNNELKNKLLMATPSSVIEIENTTLPQGLTMVNIPGHCLDMIAIKTADDIWFLADALVDESILNKYHVSYLFDVEKYLDSLEKVKLLEGKLFIPSHAEPTEDIKPLVELNKNKVFEVMDKIKCICKYPTCFEDILKSIFDEYNLKMDFTQYALIGSVIKSYLSYLFDKKYIKTEFIDNKLLWETI